LYATYLETLLDEARKTSKASLRHLVTRAARVVRSDDAWVITCADGSTTRADVVVLATGNPAPTIPPWAESLVGSPRFIADPWAPGALEGIGEETVVAIGTGLTFVDVAISVLDSSKARVIGVSRHGLMPTPHTHVEHPPPLPALHTPREVLHWLRSQRHQWREAVNGLRTITQRLWIDWTLDERRQFLRHAHRYWEVHRHRIAEPVAERIAEHLASGRLEVRKMRIEEATTTGERFILRSGSQTLSADRLIVCTGPSERAMLDDEPIASLRESGHLRPAPLSIGIDCDPRCEPQSRDNDKICDNSPRACAALVTLIVVIPIAAAGFKLMPRSSRNTHSVGSTASVAHAIS
ncbi:MAG: hypothetical protein EBT09_07495, partial [Actinobacteria bacterium]|nr:hypothetical protein [Actinomycetota bacterium]